MVRNMSRSKAIRPLQGWTTTAGGSSRAGASSPCDGETTDGNQYIDAALKAGAAAIVSDSLPPRPGVAWAQVHHGRRALARLSANFYGRPAERSSSPESPELTARRRPSFLLNAMLRRGGRKTALVGTVEYRIEDESYPGAAHDARSAGAEPVLRARTCRPAARKR